MKLSRSSISSRYLFPGELACHAEPTEISTILGSCVAITLFCPRLAVGAICHAVLPHSQGKRHVRYVDHALDHMLAQFDQRGVGRHEIEAKLFGGAQMLFRVERHGNGSSRPSVGTQNIAAAKAALRKEGIALTVAEIGGNHGRKLLFQTHTGKVFLKRFQPKKHPS